MNISPFSHQHIPETLRLSTQVGWNHTEQDWQRSIDLSPHFCLGGFIDNHLVGTSALLQHGDLGWLSTFIIDKDHQRKGLGSILLEEVLRRAEARGVTWFAVDSSDVGRPIYNRLGFVLDEPIERWTGPNSGTQVADTQPLAESHWPALLSLDHGSVGVDRERQLRHLASEPAATARVLLQNGRLVAFGFSRAGRLAGSIGPIVAQSDNAAQQIIDALLADRHTIDGDRGIALDLLAHPEFKSYMTTRGFVMRRQNIRMFRPAKIRPVLTGSHVYTATALGMG
jgi:hypothetical protein